MPKRVPLHIAISLCAALCAASPATSAPADAAPAPVFPGPDGTPHYLLGVSAFGAQTDLDRLAAAAAALGWPTARDLDSSGRTSLVIAFKGALKDQVDAFLKRAGAGEFGKFTFESTMAPVTGATKR